MKRLLLALAVNAALATPILADYLVIRINLGAEVESSDSASGAPGGGRPGGGFGLGGAGGGGIGLGGAGGGGGMAAPPPPGAGGAAGAASGGGRGRGGLGLGSGGGGMQGGGGMGQPPLPGGTSGGRPGGPGGGLNSGGRQGKGGGGAGMGAGLGGGPGGGQPPGGGLGLPGAGGPTDSQQPTGLVANKGDLFIVAIEVNASKRGEKYTLSHPWGTTMLNPATTLPNRATMQLITVKSIESRYNDARRDYVDGTNKQYLKFVDWMLENWNLPFQEGKFLMQNKFESYLNELATVAGSLSAADKAKVDALLAVRTQLNKPVTPAAEELEFVKSILPKFGADYRPLQKGHYVIFHQTRDDKVAQAKITRLESALAGILYWFAAQGKQLQVPANQLVCVLAETTEKYNTVRAMFDSTAQEGDGFYSRADNITVLAPWRVDANYQKFETLAAAAETSLKSHKLDFNKLLHEQTNRPYVPANPKPEEQEKVSSIITGQIYALAKNGALEEGETMTATREAFEQVAAANGFPARSLMVPHSLREGLAAFFSTPRSSGDENLPALWSGIGGPHWIYHPLFKKLQDARKAGGDKAEVTVDEKLTTRRKIKVPPLDILAVVTDKGFDLAEKADKNDQDFFQDKAKAESWALTYFLLKTRPEQLRKFIAELSQLPRDLELGAEIVELAFGRAFDLLDSKGEKVETSKATRLQKEWSDYMGTVSLGVETADKSK